MNRFETLWNAWQAGTLQPEEMTELQQMLQADDSAPGQKVDELLQSGHSFYPAPGEKELILQQVLQQINTTPAPIRTLPFWKRYQWAAAILLLLAGGAIYLLVNNNRQQPTAAHNQIATIQDAAPGRNGAILTLADGTKRFLDSAGNGTIAMQGKTQVALNNDQLIYRAGGEATEVSYNTMTTPRGRQFSLVLPDGSKVWLNAASSLTYPTAFTGHLRQVTVTGEAYFEVAKDKTKPFRVLAGNTMVEVTGTTFNINAYTDEAGISTTLLEGGVQISSGSHGQILAPGQQAIVTTQGKIKHVQQAATEQVVAWRNGMFNFNKADVPAVMRQLARWYDVEVVYQGTVPSRIFGGEIERSLQLSQVLNILGRMNISCRIEEKKLIVLP